eukprot:COSAG01_NODE_8088_length_2925_cov_7.743100_3_plen_210_part_00
MPPPPPPPPSSSIDGLLNRIPEALVAIDETFKGPGFFGSCCVVAATVTGWAALLRLMAVAVCCVLLDTAQRLEGLVQEQQAAIEATSEREAGVARGRLGPAGAQIVPEGTPPGAAGAAADAADAAAAEAAPASHGGPSAVAAAGSPTPALAPAPAPITLLVAPAPERAQLADREAARERELSLTKLQVSARAAASATRSRGYYRCARGY